jgi:hypothetical protein
MVGRGGYVHHQFDNQFDSNATQVRPQKYLQLREVVNAGGYMSVISPGPRHQARALDEHSSTVTRRPNGWPKPGLCWDYSSTPAGTIADGMGLDEQANSCQLNSGKTLTALTLMLTTRKGRVGDG